jgi:ADP-heptose:LPS heptosyltransferase
VAAGEWKYFSLEVSESGAAQILVTFNNPAAAANAAVLDGPQVPENLAGFYMRYGTLPTLTPTYHAAVIRLVTDSVANWIAPALGTYVIGFYGGTNGTAYDFSVEKDSMCHHHHHHHHHHL